MTFTVLIAVALFALLALVIGLIIGRVKDGAPFLDVVGLSMTTIGVLLLVRWRREPIKTPPPLTPPQ